MATVRLKSQIDYIRAGVNAIAFGSLDGLYVTSFPKLKPIFAGEAGNGLKIVFDISRKGIFLYK